MNWNYGLRGMVTPVAIASVISIQTNVAVALTGEEVNNIAREFTVLIQGKDGHGSGFIVSQNAKTYYVVTVQHVVAKSGKYAVITADKQAHEVEGDQIKVLPGVDLAVMQFDSDKTYQVAKLANSDTLSEGKPIFISGWPKAGGTGQLVRQFTDGRISGFLDKPLHGYKVSYTNVTRKGMSGAPVVDAAGRVVAVHGMGDSEDARVLESSGLSAEVADKIASLIKPGFNYGIPIKTFLSLAPQEGLYLSLQVENTPAPELGAPYVANAQPDEKDKIENINEVLDTVDKGVETIDRVRNIFRF
ncbi:S1 family peptidase [Merismopedia glauca]|uniref:Serine protease n=1 Tax=Merismopedia glauca CCAP 1448/3 TaxID=1296344 RepID=A0A2T1C7U2_9CYAN|nr:serine protease [Merismopedia glauca]PSB04319.1 serine protease [Merismopedia glauca CCAP 1448/3]